MPIHSLAVGLMRLVEWGEPLFEAGLVLVSLLCGGLFWRQQRHVQQLETREQRLRSFLETTLEGFVRFTPDGKILETNAAFTRMLRMASINLAGKSVWEFLPSLHQRTVQGNYETELKRHDGQLVPVRVSVTPSFSEIAAIDSLFILVSDLTERREYELTPRQISTMLESTDEGIVIVESPDYIVSINPAFTRITGYTLDDVMGSSIHLLGADPAHNFFIAEMVSSMQTVGHWYGDIWGKRKNGGIFPLRITVNAVHLGINTQSHYVMVLSDMSQTLHHTADELERINHYDSLTGLPNYSLFKIHLENILTQFNIEKTKKITQEAGLIYLVYLLDIDNFKEINDRLGHTVGNILLQQVARRLTQLVTKGHILARVGGDAFAMLVPPHENHSTQESTAVAKKIMLALVAPFKVHENSIFITVSLGIAQYPHDGIDATTLLESAEAAMYASKQAGRNRASFHTALRTQEVNRRLMLHNDLRQGLQQGELALWYQPQYSTKTKALCGVEAWARWHSPIHGIVSPTDFIPLTKESGMVITLGEWVLHNICSTAAHWLEQHWNFGKIWVRVATAQIEQSDFFAVVQRILQETRLPPQYLGLEIKEELLERNATYGLEVIMNLHAYGIATTIGNFGAGYASLSCLKNLPVNKLTIDQHFIHHINHLPPNAPPETDDGYINRNKDINGDINTITHAAVILGHNLGFSLIATGVETQTQLDYLCQIGCDEVQGNYLSHPLPHQEIEKLLENGAIEFLELCKEK